MVSSYFDYYHPLIQQNANGLKLVLGGTGLGKTSAIANVVAQAETERKYIYCANRIQLLNEMAEHLTQHAIGYRHLKNDTEVLIDIFGNPQSRAIFDSLLQDDRVQKYTEHIRRTTGLTLSVPDVQQACQAIRDVMDAPQAKASPVFRQLLGMQTSKVMNFFKRIMIEAATPAIKTNRALSQQDHPWFSNHPVIQALFPYMVFKRDPAVKVLLVTIQKAFFGFFDGTKNVSLTSFQGQDSGYVFFLDEFDFLESNLIDLICEDEAITEPFKFVQYFYEAMQQNKLPLPEYPVDPQIRQEIEVITEQVAKLSRQYGINFPQINHFTCTHLQDIKADLAHRGRDRRSQDGGQGITIFQTNRTIANVPIYLQETARAFDIVTEKTPLSAYILFNTVYNATCRILYLFRDLDPHAIIRAEMMRHCFETTIFRADIERIHQLPPKTQQQPTQFQKLLDSGYGLYEIQDLQQESDRDEVKLRHYSIHTTPERILRSLATHNLVFGLSATADLPRCVRNFSADWLHSQPLTLAYHETTLADVQIIQSLNDEKQRQRGNQVTLLRAEPLQHQPLLDFIEAVARDEAFGNDDTTRKYRAQRVKHFFATLLWIQQTRDPAALATDTHVLFFSSFKQIEYVLQTHPISEDGLFTVQAMSVPRATARSGFTYYELTLGQTSFIIILYDANQAQEIEREEDIKEAFYKLFWQEKPVLLVTTYPSAGNGVNLQYYPDAASRAAGSEHQTDFKGLHLLDSPFFYFDRVESTKTTQENDTSLKKNIWYMAKLYTAKLISEAQFMAFLSNIRDPNLNSRYLQGRDTREDAKLNQLATFIQALGRIERVWTPMADQIIRLDANVYAVFEDFCTQAVYADLRQQREAIISSNLRSVFAQVTAQAQSRGREIERRKDERLAEINQQTQRCVAELLEQLAAFRRGDLQAQTARSDWLDLREAVLKHDFHAEILHKYRCLFETAYFHDGELYINTDLELVPHTHQDSSYRPWQLNRVYNHVTANPHTRRYFETRGYELGFNNTRQLFFTPYCYQAILTGAVGEAGIAALFEEEGIPLAPAEVPSALFELADTKVAGQPWYIDCKNYQEHTLHNFSLPVADPDWRPKLNDVDFQARARAKLQAIDAFHAPPETNKLIYVNLASTETWTRRYVTADFRDVGDDFAAARIIVIPGVLDALNPKTYCQGFKVFLKHIQEAMLS